MSDVLMLGVLWHQDGEIRALTVCPIDTAHRQTGPVDCERVLVDPLGADTMRPLHDWWFDGSAVQRRTTAPITISATEIIANGSDAVVVAGIPEAAVLTVRGAISVAPTSVSGGTVTLTTTTPGALRLSVRCAPPFLTWEATVHAT